VLVKAFNTLNRKNKSHGDKVAAVAALLERIWAPAPQQQANSSGDGSDSAPPANPAAAKGVPEQQQQRLHRASDSARLDVLGRGLTAAPDSPNGSGPNRDKEGQQTAGSGANSPNSSSSILATLKHDSLSAWHRSSPERQAAHASLLATPKHRHANSYAADLAALAASQPTAGAHANTSHHSRAEWPAKQQQQEQESADGSAALGRSSSNADGSPTPLAEACMRVNVSGADGGQASVPIPGARISSSGAMRQRAAPDVPEQQQQQQQATGAALLMQQTATGRLVLEAISGHSMPVSSALAWLRAGLQCTDAPTQPAAGGGTGGAASTSSEAAVGAAPPSPKRRGPGRVCSPFACFASTARAMAISSDDEEHQQQATEQQQQPAAAEPAVVRASDVENSMCSEGGSGVAFQMDAACRLLMVVQPGSASCEQLQVIGVALPAAGGSGGDAVSSSSRQHTLELLTGDGGRHEIELGSVLDWAELLAGLNAMLLLLEQETPEAAAHLGGLVMAQLSWSKAVQGVRV
jgi:hypothetical protein